MLFHLGSLWRLNELGYLSRLKRISSVSGGSITSALLGLKWARLEWQGDIAQNFSSEVATPIRGLAGRTIDRGSILKGTILPFGRISTWVERAYRKHLFGEATLQELPDEKAGAPRFIINATNVQTGTLWRFARPYMADWRVGRVEDPRTSLGFAVAASSAFPPFLSPARMILDRGAVESTEGADLHREPYTTNVILTDGGVYDNLGMETVWKRYRTVLVSDAGGQMEPQRNPARNWLSQSLRASQLVDSQVRSLRKRQVVGSFALGVRDGTYWRIRGRIESYPALDTLPCPYERTSALARTPTRLQALDGTHQERLINWGYALCDAAIRSWVTRSAPPPTQFPYPASAV